MGLTIIRQVKALTAVAAAGVSMATLSSAVCPGCWAVGNKRLQCLQPQSPVPSTSLGTLPPLHVRWQHRLNWDAEVGFNIKWPAGCSCLCLPGLCSVPPTLHLPTQLPKQLLAALPVLVLQGSALSSLWNPRIAVSCILGLLLFYLLLLGSPFTINEKP